MINHNSALARQLQITTVLGSVYFRTIELPSAANPTADSASLLRIVAVTPERVEDWRCDYNEDRPHMDLGDWMARAFANQAITAQELA